MKNRLKSLRLKDTSGLIERLEQDSIQIEEKNQIMSIKIKVKKDIVLHSARIIFRGHPLMKSNMLANGYQTWTETKRMGKEDKIPRLHPLAKSVHLDRYGDYHFYKSLNKKGCIHSHEFTDFQNEEEHLLVGALNQERFFTILERDYTRDLFSFYLDLEGLMIQKETWFDLGSYYIDTGDNLALLYDGYSKAMEGPRKPGTRINGWTSWYNYYTKIDDHIIHHNLEVLGDHPLNFDVFQIDDGFQVKVGDWLETNEKFKDDLSEIAESASNKKMKPGLWLAPFICEKESSIFKEKQEWILKDSQGKPFVAGFNPGWSYNFYALDFYNPEVQAYLREVFKKVFEEWKFEMVKLDFLYAVNLLPRKGKTRAMIMSDAMDFLHEVCQGEILGCGVPMASAIKKVDYCRVGADVAAYWEDKKLRFLGYRERISTRAAIYNTLNRHVMNNRFFGNDPDVFIIRGENNKLSDAEKFTLFALNQILGNLVFFSDDISHYTDELRYMESVDPMPTITDVIVKEKQGIYTIDFKGNGYIYQALVNMNDKNSFVSVEKGHYYITGIGQCSDISAIEVKAHETVILHPLKEGQVHVLDESYMLPASCVKNVVDKEHIEWFSGYRQEKVLYIEV